MAHILESYKEHGLQPLFPSLHLQCEGHWYFDSLEQSKPISPQMT